MKPSSARGKINATRMRSQLIASVPRGVTTGAPAGLTCAFGTGVAADTAGVEVVITAGFTELPAGDAAKAEPLAKVKANSPPHPTHTNPLANPHPLPPIPRLTTN